MGGAGRRPARPDPLLHTREAGVRSLERELSNLARKAVRELERGKQVSITIDEEKLAKYAGVRKYHYGETDEEDQVGIVTGLAWTEFGGDILTIEAVRMPGKGRMSITGNLKEVMKESISAANSYVRARATRFGIKPTLFGRPTSTCTCRKARRPRTVLRPASPWRWPWSRC